MESQRNRCFSHSHNSNMDPPHNTTPPPIPSESQPPPSSAPPSPNPNPKPSPPSSQPRPRPQPPLYSHHHHLPPSSSVALPPPSLPAPSPRGPVAIGVPSHHPSPPPPSYAHFGGIARPAPAGDSSASSPVRMRMPMPAMQGMTGSVRPSGISPHHLQSLPVQSSLRPTSSTANQSPSQNFQGHNLSRASSLGSPSSPSTSQGLALHNQPWLGSQGKPPIPSSPYRPQMAPSAMMQRSHLQPQQQPLTTPPPQPKGPMPTASPQQHNMPPLQHQQPSSMHQGHGHFGQQTPPQRLPQASPRPPQNTRVQASVNQKSSSLAVVQPSTVQSTQQNRIASTEMDESCSRILSKRTIHELVNQIDPSERLDPDVEDILVDIADEFVESITTFGCSLAKHRKSTTLEAKDILLHLEKNWNITLPGFGGDEIKSYKKPITNDIHKGRIAAIKKSMSVTETANTRNSAGHATGNAKGSLAKASANISSQNIKT